MDEVDLALIGLFIDHQFVSDFTETNENTDWISTVKLFDGKYGSQCIPPNQEFASNEKLLYKTLPNKEKECNLDQWLQPIDENSINKLKSYFAFTENKGGSLIKNNLKEVAKYFPNDLEKLLSLDDPKYNFDVTIKSWVLDAIDSVPSYELKVETINYLEHLLKNNTEIKGGIEFIKPAAKILTNYVTHHDKEHTHLDFLLELIKRDSLDMAVRETIFKKFSEDIGGIRNWGNGQFDSIASVLSDCSSHVLVKGVFTAQKLHGYIPDIDKIPFFEKCLDNPVIRGAAGGFIAKSLEKCLMSKLSNNDFSDLGRIEDHAINLLNKTGRLESGLVNAIFEFYKENQSHFNGLIVDLVASDKLLSTGLLRELLEPLTKIEDPKAALFITIRLAQHYIPLPSETLSHFLKYLNDKDEHLSILATNLYYQKCASIPEEVKPALAEALITLLPKSSEMQHSKINDILDGIKLNEDQSLKRGIQKRIYDWHRSGSLEEKISISRELSNKISDKTVVELDPFFREHLLTQNVELVNLAKSAYGKLGKYKEITLSKEEQELLAFEDLREDFSEEVNEGDYFELEVANGVKFVLTAKQWDRLVSQFSVSWIKQKHINRIVSTSYRELSDLLEYIHANYFTEKEFNKALGESSNIASLCDKLAENSEKSLVWSDPVKDILEKAEKQEPVSEIQKRVLDWYREDNFELKIGISKELSNKINGETAAELIDVFRDHLFSQNIDLAKIAKSAFEKLGEYREITWNEEEHELLSLFEEVVDTDVKVKIENSFSEITDISGTKFLLNSEQWYSLEEKLSGISWNIKGYIKKIEFTDIRELEKLIDFIKINKVSLGEFHAALDKRSDIPSIYSKLLNSLIAGIGDEIGPNLSLSDKKALKVSTGYLVDEMKWPVDFLFNLIKETEQESLVKLISVLEKLANYSVSHQAFDREGITAFEILKKASIERLSESISRVINDNHFYMSKDIRTLLEEVERSNSNNPRLQGLIESKYFNEQLLKIAYGLEINDTQPINCEPNRLYVYRKDDKIYIETIGRVRDEISLDDTELDQLSKAIEGSDNILRKKAENLIYRKAAQLGIGLESIDIKPILIGSSKPLEEWDNKDFLEWRKGITKVNDDNIAEVIGVISQAAYNTYLKKSYPRPVQLISILSLFKSPNGGLAQIATGEGKSLIVAIFAMINAFEGKQVDILTSSSVLAMRDVDDLKAFYSQLGVSVAHNIDGSEGIGKKACYTADVTYGDTRHFIGDGLRDLSNDVKQGRGFDIVIIDEVDNVLIDQINMKVQLSSTIPGSEALIPIYTYMYGTALAIASNLKWEGEKCYLKMPLLTDEQKATIEDLDLEVIEDESYEPTLLNGTCSQYIREQLTNFVKDKLFAFEENRPGRPFIVPSHLEGFVKDQLQKWINSLEMSFYLQEKVHYINTINPEPNARYPFKIVAPIDYENTGVIQYGLQWSDGQHQFIQGKHGLTMYPENVLSVFMSYFGFFNKYSSIFGVTGTLGEKPHHEFLKKVYGVELSVIPTFIEKDLSKFPPIVVETKDQWHQEIKDVVKRTIGTLRAGLIVVETIEEVENLKAFLENSGYDKSKIFVYGTGLDSSKEYDVANKRELEPGEIVIATNMAGRGTDLKISAKVKMYGGLHVMVAVFPESVRVEDQNFGRSARQGEPGSAQVIVSLQQIEQTACNTKDIKCLTEERNEKEIEKLEEYRLCRLPGFEILDKLFDSFVDLVKEVDSPTNYKVIVGKPEQQAEPKSIYLYLESGRILIDIVHVKAPGDNKDSEPIDITKLLSTIDPRAAKHIRTSLSDNRSSLLTLNKQDYEIIHFIAARKGYTDYPEIYKRIEGKFYEESKKEGFGKNAYLSNLLKNNTGFADLRSSDEIDANALEKAEIRKLYELWIADRNSYNNKYEIQQITEYWGVWLKKYSALVENAQSCNIGNEEGTKEFFRLLFEDLKSKFDEFRTSIAKEKDEGKLFENPNYLVLKAWQYLGISMRQSNFQNPAAEGWYDYIARTIEDTIYIVSGKRISFGRENYLPNNPLESAMGFLKRAIELDDIYSWTAYNALAVIGTIKDGAGITKEKQAKEAAEVKQRLCDNQGNAIRRILEWRIPPIDAEIAFSLISKVANYEDDHLLQLIGTKEILLKIVSRMQNAIDVVVKSTGKEGIRVGRFIPYDEITKDINITEAILKAANKTGDTAFSARLAMHNMAKGTDFPSKQFILDQIVSPGGYIHELFTYELEEQKRDWAGTILAVVVAVASIYTGLWLINVYGASSIFMATVGSGLLSQGIGDIVQAAIAVGTGNPIDAESYINSKGIAAAVTLATAGFLQIANTLPAIQGLGILQAGADKMVNLAQSPVNLIATIGVSQVTTRAIGMGLQSAGKNLVDEESIKSEAEQSINEIIISHKEELNIIYAADEFNYEFNGRRGELQSSLNHGIEVAVYKHQGKFHSDQATVVTGVASQVGGAFANAFGFGNVLNAGMQFAMGAVKNAKAMSKVYAATEKVIGNTAKKALSTGAMMGQLLSKNLGMDQGGELFKEVKAQGLIKNGEIEYRKCDEFKLVGKLASFNDALRENCKTVGRLLLKERDFGELRENFVNWVSGLKISIQSKEMLGAFTNLAAVEAGQVFGSKIVNLAGKKIEEGKQARAAQGEKGKGTGGKSKFGYEREKANAEEIAQKSGLNRQPETGKDGSGQGQGGGESSGETPGWKPVEREVLVATDGTEYSGGIRIGTQSLGDSKEENVEYIASKMHAEIDGKEYVVFKASKRILGEDGRNIKNEEIWIDAVELRNADDFESIESSLALADTSRHRVSGSININSAGGLEGLKPGELGKIQAEMLRAFASNAQDSQNEPFNILVSSDRSDVQPLEAVLPIKNVETKTASAQEIGPKTSYPVGGMVGSGLLTLEDVELAKEYFRSEEFKIYLSGVGEGFVDGFVDMGKDAVDLAKIVAKYGLEPSAVTMFRMILAVDKFQAANAGREWEVVKEGAFKAAKEVWRDIVETTTTGKGHGRILAEATAGFGIGRAVKGLKIAGKIVDEVMDADVCPRGFGLVDEGLDSVTKFKMGDHSPIVPGGGLQGHESLKFHTIERHIEKSLEYLKTRFIKNPDLKFSSTFYNRAITEKVISEAIDKDIIKINKWVKNPTKPVYEIDGKWKEPVGIRIARDSNIVEHIDTFIVVLRIDPQSPLGYKILTAYPLVP